MKKNSRGFTLIEIIIVVALLGIVGTIFIINSNNILNANRQRQYDETKQIILSSAEAYLSINNDIKEQLYEGYSYIDISIGDMRDAGLLSEDIKNAYTGEIISDGEVVRVDMDLSTNILNYEYIDKEITKNNLNRLNLIAEDLILTRTDANIDIWTLVDEKTSYNSIVGESSVYFEDKNRSFYSVDNIQSHIVEKTNNINIKKVGSYTIEYTYQYNDLDTNEVIQARKTRNVFVVPEEIKLEYHGVGGTFDDNRDIYIVNLKYGQDYNIISSEPKRDGYKFLGWSYSENSDIVNYVTGQKILFIPNRVLEPVNGEYVFPLYAVWELAIFDVLVNVTNGTSNVSSKKIEAGSTGTFVITPAFPYLLTNAEVNCNYASGILNSSTGVLTVSSVRNNTTCNIRLSDLKSCSVGTLINDNNYGYICKTSASSQGWYYTETDSSYCGWHYEYREGACIRWSCEENCNKNYPGQQGCLDACWIGNRCLEREVTRVRVNDYCDYDYDVYYCASGWSTYSGSGSSLNCYKRAS